MRKNINLPVYAILGATVFLVGFARNARAIPDSMGSWISGNEQSEYDAVRSIDRSHGNQYPTGISSFAVFAADLRENNGEPHNPGWHSFDRDVSTTPTSTSHDSPPLSVPDGGTTAMMLGGALCGLFLVAKKTKV
jgi:hypothetical protein